MTGNDKHAVKWLRVMMYTALASVVNSVVNILPFVPAGITVWTGRAIMIVMILSLLQLGSIHEGYRKAGTLRAAMLICTLIAALGMGSSVLTLVGSVLSIIAVYREYNTHSELLEGIDPRFAAKWHRLFTWSVVAAILIGFGSTVSVLILSMAGMDAVGLAPILLLVLGIPDMILGIVYLRYLKKMALLFENGNADAEGGSL